MSKMILILGESGTGKSTSIRTLNPAETFIINVLNKPLPFRNFEKVYTKATADSGNYIATDNPETIQKIIQNVSDKRPEIKNIIIDDFQYILSNEYMRRCKEKGYDKFNDIGKDVWDILNKTDQARSNLKIFVLSHSQLHEDGKIKCKTIGKMTDEKVSIEGRFAIVLHTIMTDDKYQFLTQFDGVHLAKSPIELFATKMIDNDLNHVVQRIDDFYNI